MSKLSRWRLEGASFHRWRVFGCVFAISFIAMSLWALASPLISVPDEQVHAVRAAAVVRGDLEGVPSATEPWLSIVEVPRYVANTQQLRCFVGDVNETPLCQKPAKGDQDELIDGFTTATSNSPGFYAIAGLPTLILSGPEALYGMRLLVAFLCSALVALAFASIVQLPRRRWSMIALGVATTPMVLYLGGSLNPNGLEVASMAALFTSLFLTFTAPSPGRLLWERLAVVAVSATLLSNTRSIALLWVGLAVIGAVLLADRTIMASLIRRPATWVSFAAAAIGVFAALLWFIVPHGLATAPPFAGAGSQPLVAFQLMLDRTVEYGLGWVGYFGWLDRPAPGIVAIWWAVCISGIVVAGLVLAQRRHRISIFFWLAGAVLVPAFVQASVVAELGYIWQGRYTLSIFVCLLLAAGIALDRVWPLLVTYATVSLLRAGIWITACAHVLTFVWVLRRYVVGSDSPWTEMILRPTWQPPLGWITLSVLYAMAICAGAILLIRSSVLIASSEPEPANITASQPHTTKEL